MRTLSKKDEEQADNYQAHVIWCIFFAHRNIWQDVQKVLVKYFYLQIEERWGKPRSTQTFLKLEFYFIFFSVKSYQFQNERNPSILQFTHYLRGTCSLGIPEGAPKSYFFLSVEHRSVRNSSCLFLGYLKPSNFYRLPGINPAHRELGNLYYIISYCFWSNLRTNI